MRSIWLKKNVWAVIYFLKIDCLAQVKHTGDLCIPVWLQRSAHCTNTAEVGV